MRMNTVSSIRLIQPKIIQRRHQQRQKDACSLTACRSVIFLASVVICLWQVSTSLILYYSSPVTTQVRIEKLERFQFPEVTVCGDLMQLSFNSVFEKVVDEKCSADNDCKDYATYPLKKLNISLDDIWKTMKVTDVMMVTRNVECVEDRRKCTASHLEMMTIPGPCDTLTINSSFQYQTSFSDIAYLIYKPTKRLYINFHGYKTLFLRDLINSFLIEVGHQLEITLSYVEFYSLQSYTNPCTSYNEIVSCLNKCLHAKLTEASQCSLPSFKSTNLAPCETFKAAWENYDKVLYTFKNFNQLSCSCAKKKCSELVYNVQSLSTSLKEKTASSSFTTVRVSEIKQVINEISVYTFSSLLSDLAGNVGFFLGVSLLSLLDFVAVLFKRVC